MSSAPHQDEDELKPSNTPGYKPTAAKSTEEYAQLDAEDESLARWKASLGIVPGSGAGAASGPKVTVLTLELGSPTLPPGKTIVFELSDPAKIAELKKTPITIKEGVEYKGSDTSKSSSVVASKLTSLNKCSDPTALTRKRRHSTSRTSTLKSRHPACLPAQVPTTSGVALLTTTVRSTLTGSGPSSSPRSGKRLYPLSVPLFLGSLQFPWVLLRRSSDLFSMYYPTRLHTSAYRPVVIHITYQYGKWKLVTLSCSISPHSSLYLCARTRCLTGACVECAIVGRQQSLCAFVPSRPRVVLLRNTMYRLLRHLPSASSSLRCTRIQPAFAPWHSLSPCSLHIRNRNIQPSDPNIRYSSTSSLPPAATEHKTWVDHLPTKIRPYLYLTRIDKPIGTLLLFYPCTWSITMAAYSQHLPLSTPLTYIGLCGIGALVMRGAGCTINDMWDKNLDRSVERTKLRPIAAGIITRQDAFIFLGGQLAVGLAVLLQFNWYSILLGASSLSLVTIYPLMKRITYWPQAVLGLAFNWGALLGWSAVSGTVDWAVCLPLYAGGVCWTLVYDSIYAHQDKRDDVNVGIKSTALLFGEHSRSILAGLSASSLSLISYAGYVNLQTEPFFVGVALAAIQLGRILYRTDFDDRASCWKGFVGSGWAGFWIWMGAFADYGMELMSEPLVPVLVQ